MGFAPLEANSGGGGGGHLGQRQALFLFFSLSLSPFCPCSLWSLSYPWGLLESLGVLVTIIGLVFWPACLLDLWALGGFGGVGSVGLQFHIDRVVFGGPLWPAEFGGPVGPFSLLARVSSFYWWSFVPSGSVSLCQCGPGRPLDLCLLSPFLFSAGPYWAPSALSCLLSSFSWSSQLWVGWSEWLVPLVFWGCLTSALWSGPTFVLALRVYVVFLSYLWSSPHLPAYRRELLHRFHLQQNRGRSRPFIILILCSWYF